MLELSYGCFGCLPQKRIGVFPILCQVVQNVLFRTDAEEGNDMAHEACMLVVPDQIRLQPL